MTKCSYEGCSNPPTHTAPQMVGNASITWHPICSEDHDAWWEGSDYPGGEGAPAQIIPLSPNALALIQGRLVSSVQHGALTVQEAAAALEHIGMPNAQAISVIIGTDAGFETANASRRAA